MSLTRLKEMETFNFMQKKALTALTVSTKTKKYLYRYYDIKNGISQEG